MAERVSAVFRCWSKTVGDGKNNAGGSKRQKCVAWCDNAKSAGRCRAELFVDSQSWLAIIKKVPDLAVNN